MSETNYYSEEIISGIKIAVLVSSKGIKKIFLNSAKEINEFTSATKLRSDDPYLFGIFNQLKEYFAGTRKEFEVPLDLKGTDFQKKVWQQLQKIPYGKTISYKSLSEKLGDVKSIRAVGKANGQNPVAIVIPCHRVIGADGSLIGYAGGLAIKEKLLHLEGALNPELFD
jgi:methylated-DNA-[protein]-cysteine S-methyltransferase